VNPFDGGEVKLFGLLRRGKVRSSRESVQYFADLNHDSAVEVELVAHAGGHVIPQPYWRYPRIWARRPKEPNGPAVIWAFFERQQPR